MQCVPSNERQLLPQTRIMLACSLQRKYFCLLSTCTGMMDTLLLIEVYYLL